MQQPSLPDDAQRPQGKTTTVRDLPINRKWVELILRRQLYRCDPCKGTAKEPLPGSIHPTRKMTMRLFNYIGETTIRRTDADLSREVGLAEDTISEVFAEFSNEVFKKTKFEMPEVLAYDEKLFWRGHFCCVVGNIKERTLINILPGRDTKVLDAYFESRADRHKVKVVCIDMRKEFRSIARKWFPDAAIVVDRFHVEGMAVAVVEIIRKQRRASTRPRGARPAETRVQSSYS